MAECPSCGTGVREGARVCATCGAVIGTNVEGGIKPDADTRKFVVAGTAEDPLSADELVEAIEQAGIPVMARARRRGVVEPITSPSLHGWWEILVPEENSERATQIIDTELERLEAEAEEAARAAEEEEAESETQATKT
jgi:hypothetical protein